MEKEISRKQLLGWTGAAFAAMASASVFAHDHEHDHKKGKKGSKKEQVQKASKQPVGAIDAAAQCVVKGQICINMCIEFLGEGHQEMADCLRSVEETSALCEAFIKLASRKSPGTKKLASLCLESCERCAIQCDKHADHHQECKDCSDSCKACIEEFKKIIAA
ncbi:twin-arginine translocation signal protein [Leptospira wolffii]|uniref:Twin-arginine translocation signal protein n=1 Tax=Leptospira wolffii TaxID=409998 RepID=A0A2M9Z8J4_9LEPT|nr:four-helix bundle copper-binding protein [Leptospira wolffii]PJZ64730.1 twin-arginine translocation signal protein [Leptospira wolffii]